MKERGFFGREISAYERSILRMRAAPELADVVRREFLDEDLEAAVERFAQSDILAEILLLARRNGLQEGGRVLDLGGGRGLLSRVLQEKGYQVTLLEISRSPVVGLGALAGGEVAWRAVCGNGEAVPFRAEQFDLVICKQVLHHTRRPRRMLAEAHRVLRPGGAVIAYREHCLPWYGGKKRFLENHPGGRYGAQENAFRTATYSLAFWLSGFREVGLCDILSPPALQEEYLEQPGKRRWLALPGIGRGIFWLAYWKYFLWRYWCGEPGQTMTFCARKSLT